MEQLAHRARHPGFALDPLDVEILGVLVRPVIGIHRLAERLRGRFPVAIMVAIAMAARLALPGNGPELLRHLLTVLRLLAFLCLLTGALGGKPLLTLRLRHRADRDRPRRSRWPRTHAACPISAALHRAATRSPARYTGAGPAAR